MQHTQILTSPVNFKTEISNAKSLEMPNQKTAPNPKINGMQVKCSSTTPNEAIAMDCCLSLLGGLSPRQTSMLPKAARPSAPCATYCYHAWSL